MVGILSMGMMGVVKGIAFAGRMAALSGDIMTAVLVAQEKFQEFEWKEKGKALPAIESSGEEEVGKFHFLYQWAPDHDLGLGLWDARVSWKAMEKENDIPAQTFFRI